MSVIVALLAGILGAAAGFVAGLALGSILASALSISSFEGGAGYFAVAIGLLAGMIGFLLAVVLTLRIAGGHKGFRKLAGRTAIVILAAAALVAVGIQIRLATLENFRGPEPRMRFEIRLPPQKTAPAQRAVDIEMQAGAQRSGASFADDWLRREGDRQVIAGFVPLYTRTSQRMLVVTLPDTPKLLFSIRLAATPRAAKSFGDWQRLDYLDDGKADSRPRRPDENETYEIRYYVAE